MYLLFEDPSAISEIIRGDAADGDGLEVVAGAPGVGAGDEVVADAGAGVGAGDAVVNDVIGVEVVADALSQ